MGLFENLRFGFAPEYAEFRLLLLQIGEQEQKRFLQALKNQLGEAAEPQARDRALERVSDELSQLRGVCEAIRQTTDGAVRSELRETQAQCEAMLDAALRLEKEIRPLYELSDEIRKDLRSDADFQKLLAAAAGMECLPELRQSLQRVESALSALSQRAAEPAPPTPAPRDDRELQRLQAELQRFQAERQTFAAELQRMQAENAQAQAAYKGLTAKNARLLSEQKDMQAELARLRDENERLRKAGGGLPKAAATEAVPAVAAAAETAAVPANPYALGGARMCFTTAEEVARRFGDTAPMDRFFADVDESSLYRKIYARFRKRLDKALAQADEADELHELLATVFAQLVYNDLLKGLIVSAYRKQKNGEAALEARLLAAINEYLLAAGVYNRTDSRVGGQAAEQDFLDMQMIPDRQTKGLPKNTITEIELYPYYVDYQDEDGTRQSLCTQGVMVVIA